MMRYGFVISALSGIMLGCLTGVAGHGHAQDTAYIANRLPYPTEWRAAAGLPEPPGDAFTAPGAATDTAIPADAPVISEWNRVVHPGEGFTMTGIRFTRFDGAQAGSDTTVWIWHATPDGGRLTQAGVWFVQDALLTATLPDDIPFGMVLVWVENDAGISAPVALNRTTAEWIGPLGSTVRPGAETRVFGRNLATGHGSHTSHVYLQGPDGHVTPCPVTGVEPYAVTFTVSAHLAAGDYRLYVHNGHGGVYGWSDALSLTIDSTPERGDPSVAEMRTVAPVSDSAAAEIQAAIDAMHANPDGGTVWLSPGTYTLETDVVLKRGVRLTGGGGRHETILTGAALRVMPETAIENLTAANGIQAHQPRPELLHDVRIANVETRRFGWRGRWHERIEIADSAVEIIDIPGADVWVHGNTITGDRMYEHAGIYPFGRRVVIERNHFRNDWPVDAEGNKLLETSDAIPREHRFADEPGWIARMVCVAGRGYKPVMDHHYIAHNTSEDVTSEGNIGEMILFHDHRGTWFSRVAASEGTRLSVCTDGLTDGDDRLTISDIASGGPVRGDAGDYVIIIGGTGLGQARRIAAIDGDILTLDDPWRIEPDTSSVIVIAPLWVNNIVYRNQLNAFPAGYRLETHSASTGINIWGNTWAMVAEGNVARRTAGGRNIHSTPLTPSFWNEFRNEEGRDTFYRSAFYISGGAIRDRETRQQVSAPGAITLGNVFRGGVFSLNEHPVPRRQGAPLLRAGASLPDGPFIPHVGNIVERIEARVSELGIAHAAMGMTLFRHNALTLTGEGSVGASVHAASDALLSGNRYIDAGTRYADTGGAARPVVLHRVAHVHGRAGEPLAPVVIPVVNAGIAPMEWEVVPGDGWLTADLQPGGNLEPEAIGSLTIAVDTAQLEPGTHTGSLTIVTAHSRVGVTVRVVLE